MKYNIILNGKTKAKDLTLFGANKRIIYIRKSYRFVTIVLLNGKDADDNAEFVIVAL